MSLVAAQALSRLERFADAEGRIAAVAAEAPGDVRPAASLVALRIEAGQARVATQNLLTALDSFVGDADTLYDFGESLATLDVDEHALTAYRAALDVDPDHARALVGAGNLDLNSSDTPSPWPHLSGR